MISFPFLQLLLRPASLLGLGLGLLSALALHAFYRQWASTKSIKGPKHWPLLGATLEYMSAGHRYYDWITDYARRFPTFEMTLFASRRVIFTTLPTNIEYFLKSNSSNYWIGKTGYETRQEFLGDGILNADGENRKQQRKIISFEFARKVLHQRSVQIFRKNAIKLATILAEKFDSPQNLVDMSELLKLLSFETIFEIVCGVEMGALSSASIASTSPFLEAFESANKIIGGRFYNPFWKIKHVINIGTEAKLKKDVHVLNQLTEGLIQKKREQMSHELPQQDHFDILSRALTLDQAGTVNFSEKRLRDMIFNLVAAGGDTVSTTMSWFLFALSQHPEVERKVRQEIDAMWPKSDGDIAMHSFKDDGSIPQNSYKEWLDRNTKLLDYESLASMHYLHAALCETLRLYPAVAENGRIAIAKDVLPDGTLVREGDIVVYQPYAMGRMTHIWGMDAPLFKPERWFDKDGVFQPQPPYKFSAFHAGPHMCPGKDFAFLQLKMTSIILLKVFKFQLSDDHVVRYSQALTLGMENGLHMYVGYA